MNESEDTYSNVHNMNSVLSTLADEKFLNSNIGTSIQSFWCSRVVCAQASSFQHWFPEHYDTPPWRVFVPGD